MSNDEPIIDHACHLCGNNMTKKIEINVTLYSKHQRKGNLEL